MIKTGDVDRAEVVAGDMTEPRQKISALAQVAMAVTKLGDLKRCGILLDRAEVIARAVTDPDVQAELAIAFACVNGDVDYARAIVDNIGTSRGREEALARVVQALAATGDSMGAQSMLSNIVDADLRANFLAEVAAAFARAGDIDHARQIVAEIADPQSHGKALLLLAATRRAAGETTRHDDIQRDLLAEGLQWTTHWSSALPDLVAIAPTAFEEVLHELNTLTDGH